MQELRGIGLNITEFNLRGRFHTNLVDYDLDSVMEFCDSNEQFQLPEASQLVLPTRSNTDGTYVDNGKLHHVALRSILVEQSNWYKTFSAVQTFKLSQQDSLVISFGLERCIPPTISRKLISRVIHVADLEGKITLRQLVNGITQKPSLSQIEDVPANYIAVTGMSLKVAGADDLEEFWKILCAGTSQHAEVPSDRFTFDSAWRENDPGRKWYGNFIRDPESFDHKFFKKSPREMASTDPQQRLILQAAYQALEQSGYFQRSSQQDKHIGCYIGVGTVDYENNITCHPANAYSATGNLKSFVAGKVSHHFGWTGPGLTIDTACSASAVAVHQACKAILGGDCTAALAGGATIMTSPQWFQNLAGASFLSPTGACKPFDAKADGYCRGEGIGTVFLKRLSSALADGDQILGVIAGSGVYQNQNCTPITVPNAESLSDLFGDVLSQANLQPKQISVVEAHGTGTPVGDPAEYDGLRRTLGGPSRTDTLFIGSVKGLVGHAECASGIVALIKTLLMLQEAAIPPQASFDTLNPAIQASPSDNMEVTTRLKPWENDFRATLINNYGASGSNASMVVTQAPESFVSQSRSAIHSAGMKHPFCFCAADESSLRAYVKRFNAFLASKTVSSKHLSLSNLAFNVARQSNRTLPRSLVFGSTSIDEVQKTLAAFENGKEGIASIERPASRPVILCFGGQVSTFVGLDRQIFDSCKLLRNHLDQCNAACQSIGVDGIYPEIFQKTPFEDPVKLQTSLFALQYSCARTWMDCGIEVAATVGHSFGELTSLCVVGTLSLENTIKMITTRARLVRDVWGSDRGAMMAVEADHEKVEELLKMSNEACACDEAQIATIACFNGPRSFTVAGSTKAIEAAQSTLSENSSFSSMRVKRLNVTNAFHCALVDPLVLDLKRVGQDLTIEKPNIHMERATENHLEGDLKADFVASHMRSPVYFNHAVQRLAERYPSSLWLEAGSNSTITTMAGRALGNLAGSSHFQPINITSDNSFQNLTDATMNLWKQGLNVSFWSHHMRQTSEFAPLLIPPYQFEKSRHWMDWKKPQLGVGESTGQESKDDEPPNSLWTFVQYQDSKQRSARFQVNVEAKQFREYVAGHTIAEAAPLCPNVLQVEIVIEALMSLKPDFATSNLQPQLQSLDNLSPLCLQEGLVVWLDAEAQDTEARIWKWQLIGQNHPEGSSNTTTYVAGQITFVSPDDEQVQDDFARYERLIKHDRCARLLDGNDADDVIQGRNIYKTFSDIVDYSETYRGVQKIVGKGNESAGRVIKPYFGDSWLETPLADSFCQVGGIYVNCMTDKSHKDISICNRIERWVRSPKLRAGDSRPESWDVFVCHHRASEKQFISDIFVFDPRDGALLEMILGVSYQRVAKAGLGKMLIRLTEGQKSGTSETPPTAKETSNGKQSKKIVSEPTKPAKKKPSAAPDISEKVKTLMANISGLEPSEFQDDTNLASVGIDSLMAMELTREIEGALKCTLDTAQLYDVTDFKGLIKCIRAALALPDNESDDRSEEYDSEEESESDSERSTAETSVADADEPNSTGVDSKTSESSKSLPQSGLDIPASVILEAFGETKKLTDDFIQEHRMGDYVKSCLPKQTELCVAHIVEAFASLGCDLKSAKPGQQLERIQHLPTHDRLVEYLYMVLEKEARLIDINGQQITRTAISPPTKSADTLLVDLCRDHPDHANDHKLTYLTGSKLADCLTGKSDGIQLIFGSQEGRSLVSSLYGRSPINMVWLKQMERFVQQLVSKLDMSAGPLKILEMGAGTGGTTAGMVKLFASLGVPVEYTFTDLSPSLVAAARKKYKEHAFMKFRVHDIEKPEPDLLASQHIVIANNCVHATRSLKGSTGSIRQVLRPDGFLMMVEMTDKLYWVDLIFGLLEGWWMFDDGRRHAVAHQDLWEQSMHSAGYGHVDYTEGHSPEADVQRMIIALASGPTYERLPKSSKIEEIKKIDCTGRQAVIDEYVQRYTSSFSKPESSGEAKEVGAPKQCVLVTGATGSLGCHLVSHFARLPDVATVICINRRSNMDAKTRQYQSLESRGIDLDSETLSKLKIFETDTSKPSLGLIHGEYKDIVDSVTHIVHNAWPMSIKRPLAGFESQLQAMRNLIDLARTGSYQRSQGSKVGFQFISSIATVGHYPLWSKEKLVSEEPMTVESILPSGYSEAKLICENMLAETLQRYPDSFRAMNVRIGQIAGSKTSGYWNPVEHFSFLMKSSQVLKTLPDFQGVSRPSQSTVP